MPGTQPDTRDLVAFNIQHPSDASDTMRAWERFLTGDPLAIVPGRNFVVSSWLRSQKLGINPHGRAAPLVARGDAMETLRVRHADLLGAAADVFTSSAELFDGSRSVMLLTNPDGIVLDAVGDHQTLDDGQTIHLMQGGDWREDTVGTNGIGTALATRRPAQVHASEHFCEGIKAWTCAAAPIFESGTGDVLGVVDISGPTTTYQRNNLSLAVAIARQIEMVLNERATRERTRLLEICLERMSASDVAGLVAIDRDGRLVHSSGRLPNLVPLGKRLPGLDSATLVEDWAAMLPEALRRDWFNVIRVDGRAIGAVLVIPEASRGTLSHGVAADPPEAFAHIIGRSGSMEQTFARVRQLRDKRVPVLIEGETGVGKELFARALHGEPSETHPFVIFNCGAVVKELLASELFGYVRGAFTGATAGGAVGRFEQAHGGTLCLDEIGELPLDLQSLLLRVLEEGAIYRLGSGQPRPINVRLVALTNRHLLDEVAAGRFRRDLYHRLSVTRIEPPPLRDRGRDVDLLIAHFNRKLAAKHSVAERHFGDTVMDMLRDYNWPGNVRELRNMVESLLLMSDSETVTEAEAAALLEEAPARTEPLTQFERSSASLEDAERAAITQAMRHCRGNLAESARQLRISRSTLYRKMERYGLSL
ncbi:MAG TPA: sigma-54-dependent Fis family transcriptional regulator [Acidisoma sp.]|nr:sigma-54-dependent Fis family transcriptional regulator [Acidisoma sp.]